MRLAERIKQAFLAQAVGDAFCYEFEFCSPKMSEVLNAYNSNKPLSITDDTQMAMFGLYALGIARRRERHRLDLCIGDVRDAYVAWWRTQMKREPDGEGTWLEKEPLMRRPRAPGLTCMSSCRDLAHGETVHNDSKGNGAVMRTLPFAFAPDLLAISWPQATALAIDAGRLTHKHEDSSHAVAMYMATARILRTRGPEWYIDTLASPPTAMDDRSTFTALPAMQMAQGLIGEALAGGFADERFSRMLMHASLGRGDSDTVAAIAGGLYGLVRPAPTHLVNRLNERAIIVRLVDWAVGEDDVCAIAPEVQPGSGARTGRVA